MDNKQFSDKWQKTLDKDKFEETDLFVPKGFKPITQRQLTFVNYHKLIRSFIGDKKIESGLELGCGRGTISLYLSDYDGVKMTLLDLSDEAIELAKNNFKKYNQDGTFMVGDSAKLPFEDNSFDLTISMGLLEHLENYQQIIKEQYRVLKPGGLMISMNVPGKFSIQEINKVYKLFKKIFQPVAKLQSDYYRNNDQPSVYRKKAEEAGFKDCYTVNANPVPLFAPMSIKWDKKVTKVWKAWVGLRRVFLKQPYKTNYLMSQCHFLVGKK